MTTATRNVFGGNYGGSAPENYERFFVPAIGAPAAHEMVELARLEPGERVLDVACGTGIVARLAAERVGPTGAVAGLDINPAMLATARAVNGNVKPPISWYETGAESMPLPDGAFDVVLCQLGLQFMADRGAALREMHRVAVPGGRVLVSVPTPNDFWAVPDRAFERYLPPAAGFVRAVFALNDPIELERLMERAGFGEIAVRPQVNRLALPAPAEFLWQYVQSTPLGGILASADPEVLAALERAVVAGWAPWVQGDGMVYDQTNLVAEARR
jgi:SAM-dependent methyltransferase